MPEPDRKISVSDSAKASEHLAVEKRPDISIAEQYQKQGLSVDEQIKQRKALSDIDLREKTASFFMWTFAISVFATFAIFFLHGFKVRGFSLPNALLSWLGAATIGEVAGLGMIVYKALFTSRKQ